LHICRSGGFLGLQPYAHRLGSVIKQILYGQSRVAHPLLSNEERLVADCLFGEPPPFPVYPGPDDFVEPVAKCFQPVFRSASQVEGVVPRVGGTAHHLESLGLESCAGPTGVQRRGDHRNSSPGRSASELGSRHGLIVSVSDRSDQVEDGQGIEPRHQSLLVMLGRQSIASVHPVDGGQHEVPRRKALPELDPRQQPAERLIPDPPFRTEISGEDDHCIYLSSFESIGPDHFPDPAVEKGKPAHQKNAYHGQSQEGAQHRGKTERADRSPEKNQPGEVADRAEPQQRGHPERRQDQPRCGGQDDPHAGAANPGRPRFVRGQDSVPAKVSEEYFPTAEWRA